MPAFLDNSDGGAMDLALLHITQNADFIWYIADYALGDTFATVQGNLRGDAAINGGMWTPVTSFGDARRVTFNGVTGTGLSGTAVVDGHIAFVDTTRNQVLWVTNESTDIDPRVNQDMLFPQVLLQINQPTLVT